MNLQQVISNLARLAGPPTPFFSLEDMDAERSEWIANSNKELEDHLFEILKNPPNPEMIIQTSVEDFNMELSDILIQMGRKDPRRFLERLHPLLAFPQARPLIIEIIGGLEDQTGVELLKLLLIDEALTDDELVGIACALGEIGGDEAMGILKEMKKKFSHRGIAIKAEIDIALST